MKTCSRETNRKGELEKKSELKYVLVLQEEVCKQLVTLLSVITAARLRHSLHKRLTRTALQPAAQLCTLIKAKWAHAVILESFLVSVGFRWEWFPRSRSSSGGEIRGLLAFCLVNDVSIKMAENLTEILIFILQQIYVWRGRSKKDRQFRIKVMQCHENRLFELSEAIKHWKLDIKTKVANTVWGFPTVIILIYGHLLIQNSDIDLLNLKE